MLVFNYPPTVMTCVAKPTLVKLSLRKHYRHSSLKMRKARAWFSAHVWNYSRFAQAVIVSTLFLTYRVRVRVVKSKPIFNFLITPSQTIPQGERALVSNLVVMQILMPGGQLSSSLTDNPLPSLCWTEKKI